MVRFKDYTKQRIHYWGNNMAQKMVYTCDICGKEMPEEGVVMGIQHSVTLKEKGWDICDACHRSLMEAIASLKEE